MHPETKKNLMKAMDPTDKMLTYFEYGHLPPHLQNVAIPFRDAAHDMAKALPSCAERSAGLRKLLEAKDCAVRASLWCGVRCTEHELDVEEEYCRSWFRWGHLPEPSQEVVRMLDGLANTVRTSISGSRQRFLAVEKLIEAKDCFVRAALEPREPMEDPEWVKSLRRWPPKSLKDFDGLQHGMPGVLGGADGEPVRYDPPKQEEPKLEPTGVPAWDEQTR